MAKKFGKFLLFTAAVGAAGAAAYYYMRKKDSAFLDETDEDYDDFSKDADDDSASRTYVPLNHEDAPVQKSEAASDDSFTPLTETVASAAETAVNNAADKVEEFFNETSSDKAPSDAADSSEEFFDEEDTPENN